MKKVYLVLGALLIVAVGVLLILNSSIPDHYGNPQYSLKRKYFFNHQDRYNTVFLGSSRSFRNLNPKIFDNLQEGSTQSFNLGTVGTRNPEMYFLAERFIEELDSGKLKYLFIEMLPLFTEFTTHEDARYTYYLDEAEVDFVGQYLAHTNMEDANPKTILANYQQASDNRLGGLGRLWYHLTAKKTTPMDSSWRKTNGFTPLVNLTEGKNPNRVHTMEKLTEYVDAKRKIAVGQMGSHSDSAYTNNEAFSQRLLAIIEQAERKGTQVVYWISPHSDYRDLYITQDQLPAGHVMDMSNPFRYEDFYKPGLMFDNGHFNEPGAVVFSRQFSLTFKTDVLPLLQ